ncbi:MAG: porphobilinogen synthase [Alphaproteobacteria bacterium]|jgi:porphobilinogen synthase
MFNYPLHRPRRLRQNATIRTMMREYSVTANDLIMPYFILEGKNKREPITSMPQIERLSVDLLITELHELIPLGLKAIALFPITPLNLKDDTGSYALKKDNLICRTITQLKNLFPNLLIVADVALDPYTSHGHDGILDNTGYMHNDQTVDILVQQSLNQMQAGADIIAPSDMCDGRVKAIRNAFENYNAVNTLIMAYSVKYASGLYGPFRDAICSSGQLIGDKKTYQMDYANKTEALNEVNLDIQEGADIIIIKPAMMYLDIISQTADNCSVPICAYQVSGEYAMIDFAAQSNFAPRQDLILESLTAFKRAGCQLILSYFTKEFLKFNN